jgi:FAD-dependent urate hydroxylase
MEETFRGQSTSRSERPGHGDSADGVWFSANRPGRDAGRGLSGDAVDEAGGTRGGTATSPVRATSTASQATQPNTAAPSNAVRRADSTRWPVVVIGAGPYGLSAAAHLNRAGVNVRVFGEPMRSWAQNMPAGMLLRSRWEASHIADPDHELGLGNYETVAGLERAEPVPLRRFVDYGRWFQDHAVPQLERRRVTRVSPDTHGFRVELGDGEILRAERVVVATGIVPFAWRPSLFSGLPPALVSHTADYGDLGVLGGSRVAVVGGGQSALESAALLAEVGAEVEVFVRGQDLRWLLPPEEDPFAIDRVNVADPGLMYRAHRKTALGGPASAWLAATPGLFRRLPYRLREPIVYHFIRPRIAGWLRTRLAEVPISTDRSVGSVSPRNGRLLLRLNDGSIREVDHALLATGYHVDLARYGFLAPELVAGVRTRGGSPVLGAGFESSVPSLHFLGAPAGRSFGPVAHFVCGTWASAREVTRAVVGRKAPRTGFSW